MPSNLVSVRYPFLVTRSNRYDEVAGAMVCDEPGRSGRPGKISVRINSHTRCHLRSPPSDYLRLHNYLNRLRFTAALSRRSTLLRRLTLTVP